MARENLSAEDFEHLARIAHRYYSDGLTQEEAAREFGLSRSKVQRLLERARWAGVVHLDIEAPPWLHLDLRGRPAGAVRARRGHRQPPPAPIRARSARRWPAAPRATSIGASRDGEDVVAVSHGRDAGEVPRFFRPGRRFRLPPSSARWAAPPTWDEPTNPNEIAASLAERSGGRRRSACTRLGPRGERRDAGPAAGSSRPSRDTLRIAAGADLALVGIGGTDDGCTMVRSGCFSPEEIRAPPQPRRRRRHLGNYVDPVAGCIASPDSSRLIGLAMDDPGRIATVVAVVSETGEAARDPRDPPLGRR